MTRGRKEPRWVVPFLRALERTHKVRKAAEDAGIDHTTAYLRRRTHADFAAAWEAALQAHAAAKAREHEQELAAIEAGGFAPPPQVTGSAGEDLVVSGAQLKRASGERWGKRLQQAFLAELAQSANFRRASKAIGLSYEATRKRRRKDPALEAACHAAIAACQARIPGFLAEATAATFDPEILPDPECGAPPPVSIDQAIRIAQLDARRARREAALEPFDQPGQAVSAEQAEEMRETLLRKLARLQQRRDREKREQGWSYDEAHDQMIPPGWVREGGVETPHPARPFDEPPSPAKGEGL